MRKVYIDNIRWITVALVVIYMFNGVETVCVSVSAWKAA